MSLVRFLPTPSDRMGIIWSLLAVEDSIVLEYGPAGTTHFSIGLYSGLGLKFQNRIFTTHLSEEDVVMGDVTRLEEAILELDKVYEPKVIFVVASSTIAIIGIDIKGVCKYMQQETKARLVAFEQGGFKGDYSTGEREIYKQLVKEFCKAKPEIRKGAYNILGLSPWNYRMTSDKWEVESLLKECYGMELGACLCGSTSVEDIEAMGSAELNLVLGNEGLEAARLLESKYGTPYVYAVPYGYQGTLDFLGDIGNALGAMPNPRVMMRIKMKQKGMSMLGMYAMMGGDRVVPRAAVRGAYDRVRGICRVLEEAGIDVTVKLCSHSLKSITEPDETIKATATEKEWLELVKNLKQHLILADDVALAQCDASNTKVRIACPTLSGVIVATHLPFMGEKGADCLLEKILEYYQSF